MTMQKMAAELGRIGKRLAIISKMKSPPYDEIIEWRRRLRQLAAMCNRVSNRPLKMRRMRSVDPCQAEADAVAVLEAQRQVAANALLIIELQLMIAEMLLAMCRVNNP